MNHPEVPTNINKHELLYAPDGQGVMNNSQNLDDFINKLSGKEKLDLAQKLLGGSSSPITVILGGCNVVNNSLAVQLNEEPEKVADQLEKLPPELVKSLTEAIAIWIGKNKSP